jgi:orotidine-5'-phosphate decarboxylase
MNFTQQLLAIQKSRQSLLCVGLDTDPAKLPESLRGASEPVLEFNRRIIAATADVACAYKLNLAFYEAAGEKGWSLLRETLAAIPAGVITIGDAKRGDIGNTAEMYARALFGELGFGAATVNPYMGGDSVEPFLRDPERGAFVLALTSNPGGKDFQYLKTGRRPLYSQVVRKGVEWNRRRNCGLVVGATRPTELKSIRRLAPDLPILIPGIGAQGGDLEGAVRYGCDQRGYRAVINASRSIIYASSGEDFAEAARAAAIELRDAINRHRQAHFGKRR